MVADFTKPLQTQSSDEIITLINNKIAAIAKLSLNDGTWTNVPVGTVAFDSDTNQFKRKTGADTWTTVQLSLGSDSTLTLGALNLNTLTLVANPTSDNQVITATSYKALISDITLVKNTAITIVTGNAGNDFNISDPLPGELGATAVVKTINLPDASSTARGVVTIGEQTFAGLKKFSASKIQIGTHATATNNWHITSEANDGTLHIANENSGTLDTERVSITSDGKVGIGTKTPQKTLHIKSAEPIVRLEDSEGSSTIFGQIGTSETGAVVVQADPGNAAANSHIKFEIDGADKAIITSAGNVGIGTSTPTQKLTIKSATTESAYISLSANNNTASSEFLLGQDADSQTYLYNKSNTDLLIGTNNTTQVTIKNTGNVGLGITNPSQKLHVSGSAQCDGGVILKTTSPTISLLDESTATAANSAFIRNELGVLYLLRGAKGSTSWTQNSTGYWPIQIDLNNNNIQIGGTITLPGSTAKLGIGTTSPGNPLHVVAASQDAGLGIIRAENSYSGTGANVNTNTSIVTKNKFGTSQFMQWENYGVRIGSRILTNGGAGDLIFTTGADTERLRIDGSGRVGICITPYQWNRTLTGATADMAGGFGVMTYAGNTYITTNSYWDSSNRWTKKDTGDSALYAICGDGRHLWHSSLGSSAAGSIFSYTTTMSLSTEGALATRSGISSGGNLSVTGNITATGSVNSNYVGCLGIQIGAPVPTSWGQGAYIGWNQNSGDGATWFINHRGLGSGGFYFCNIDNNDTRPAARILSWIDNVGNYVRNSDYRLKTDIQPLSSCLQKVRQLKPCSFKFILQGNETNLGFIAHEVQAVLPQIVKGDKDAVDKEGNAKFQSIIESGIIPVLVGAVGEVSETVESLKQENSELRQRLQSLESKIIGLESLILRK